MACSIDSRSVTFAPPVLEDRICKGVPVDQELVTDFSDAAETMEGGGDSLIRWGGGIAQKGGYAVSFGAPGQMPPQLSVVEDGGGNRALRVHATPGVPNGPDNVWSGAALVFGHDPDICVDATGYRGVSFRIAGMAGTCELMFQVEISQDLALEISPTAACTLGDRCYSPFSNPLAIEKDAKTYEIPFTAISDGNPVPQVDPKTITSVAWKLWAPVEGVPCEADFVVDDVAFFR